MTIIVERLIENARVLGHQSQTAAFAIELVTGYPAVSLCCYCAERVEGDAVRLPRGGECSRCPYVGHECLVAIAPPGPRTQTANMLDAHIPAKHTNRMSEVVGSDEFIEWFRALDESDTDAVARIVDMLEMQGPTLPFPYSSAIRGSKFALRELRVQSRGRPLRVLYIFDPLRQAVLLIGGDKTGDDRFYEWIIPRAEQIFAQYLEELGT